MKLCHVLLQTIATVAIVFILSISGNSQTTLLTEGWESASIGQTPPAGWAVTTVYGNNSIYFLQNGNNPTSYPYAGTRMVEFQTYGQSYTENRLRRTTAVSTIGYSVVNVDFRWFTSTGLPQQTDKVAVQWSTNGATWTTAGTFFRVSSNNIWRFENLNLPSGACNQPNLYIAFYFTSYYGENCHLDEVHITGYTTAPPAPTVTTTAATGVQATFANLNGIVNANGTTTTVTFEYGTSTSYGTSVEGYSASGNSNSSISTIVGYQNPLQPSTFYHYRAVGVSAGGTVYGNDMTFSTQDTVPTVVTLSGYGTGTTTATVHGTATANGATTNVSFDYGLTTSYGLNQPGIPGTIGPDSVDTWINSDLSGLLAATTYHYRIKGVNSQGTSYGADSVFSTMGPPIAITAQATSVTSTGATLNGDVNAYGSATTVTFQYGLTPSYGTTVTYGTLYGIVLTTVSLPITSLAPSTTYHFRIVAANSYGTTYGNDSVFTTMASGYPPPAVITTNTTSISANSATLHGNVNANGSTTTVFFHYGLTSSYGFTVQAGTVTGNTLTPISASIFSLEPATVYHYRAVGVNGGGTTYGSDSVFTTLDTIPTVITTQATSVTTTGATLNGHVNANGSSTTVTFQYGLTTGYGSTVSAGTVTGNTLTPVSAGISGLTPSTLYHFRAVGINAYGTTYGNDTVFTTLANGTIPPTVITGGVTNQGATYAYFHGFVNPNGATTSARFEYGPTTAYGFTTTAYDVDGITLIPVTILQYNLTPGNFYHYRAVGTNEGGTNYGSDSTFYTNDSTSSVITLPATGVEVASAILNGFVYPDSTTMTISFDYGLTTAYGSTVPGIPAQCDTAQSVFAPINGLLPNTTYHFRVRGETWGPIYGNDVTFTTDNIDTSWILVGSPGFSSGASSDISLAFSPSGQPYTAYVDNTATPPNIAVMKFDGNNWVEVAPQYFAAGWASGVNIKFSPSGQLYISYEDGGISHKAVVKKLEGNNWITVGGEPASSGEVDYPSLDFSPSGEPYIGYIDVPNSNKATVRKFNGTSWVNVGQPGFSAGAVNFPDLEISQSGDPYLSYSDYTNLGTTVMKFNGNNWAPVGSQSFSAGVAWYPRIAFNPSDQLFIVYVDLANSYKATVRKFDGTNWVPVGNEGFSESSTSYTDIAFSQTGQPYVSFQDFGVNKKATVMKYDGANWVYEGSRGFSAGVVDYPCLEFSPAGKPYLAYNDNGYSGKTTVKYYPGSSGSGCQALFAANPDSISTNTYHFQDQSTGNILSWFWNFGDPISGSNNTSTIQNPEHTYTGSGSYIVCLSIQGSDTTCHDYTCDTIVVNPNIGCIANFTYSDSANTSTPTQFVDQSQYGGAGPITSWLWDFGDPASGSSNNSSVQNPTHLFSAPGVYTVCLSIHGPSSFCHDSTCKTLIVAGGAGCQAYFTYTINPSSGSKTVNFTDQSIGNPFSWLWEFGDGTTSASQNPVHTFDTAGTYNVCLNILAENDCSSTFCRDITILDSTGYHQVYGQVFGGDFPISDGLAMLFSVDSVPPYTQLVDTCMIDSLGVYYFTLVPDGDYYIYAIPYYPAGYLPTYYGDALNWQNATLIHLGQPVNPYYIHLLTADSIFPGNGKINGNINMIGLKTNSLSDKIMMLLMNSEGKAISSDRVNQEGLFEFSSLAYGTYLLKGELSGILSDVISVDLSPEHPQADVSMTFSGNRILGIHDLGAEVNAGIIYPNPVSEEANINVRSNQPIKATIELYNMMGQTILRMTVNLNTGETLVKIPTGTLPNGFYSMKMSSANGFTVTRKLIK